MYGVYGDAGVYDFEALTVTATGMTTALHIMIANMTAAMLRPSEMLALDLAEAIFLCLSSSLA